VAGRGSRKRREGRAPEVVCCCRRASEAAALAPRQRSMDVTEWLAWSLDTLHGAVDQVQHTREMRHQVPSVFSPLPLATRLRERGGGEGGRWQ
jgi:hypothetical protein